MQPSVTSAPVVARAAAPADRVEKTTIRGVIMSELVRLPALSRAGRGDWIRAGLATLALGMTGAFNATVSLAADDKPAASAVDTDSNNLIEIVVTARKRSENLRDIPSSITAISAATIEDAHITQLDDLNSLVTNLNVVEAHDNTPM
jgi:outer membrane receptor for ferric coprogen and ferric-rhodotorulic acid